MNRKLIGGLAAASLTVAVLGALPLGAEAQTTAKPDKTSAAALLAKESSRNLIKSRAPQLKIAKGDTFSLAQPVLDGPRGLQYASYKRSYQGLETFGGDFVVTTNNKGQILGTTVAQTKPINLDSVKPAISAAKATEVAKRKLLITNRTMAPKLVVYALGTPKLAYRVGVAGRNAEGHTTGGEVYVDARTGKSLDYVEHYHYVAGEGTSRYNGPSPLAIDVTQSGSNYILKDPDSGVSCQNVTGSADFTSTDNKFGNGVGTDRETGCVDSLYAVETEHDMLVNWFGRDNFDGQGGAWPVRVGLNDVNAYYCGGGASSLCGSERRVEIGYSQDDSEWLSSLDVVGHEFGHGIDHTSPGGISRNGTQEFVADVLGTLTEHYANQTSAYDEPDYTIGEEANLLGAGPIRVMYKPSTISGHPDCYSSSLPSSVHAAAGPGNHWFYLLAEGTNPTGKPASATCNNGGTLTGIGHEKAGKIFYNAMQMKTTSSSYPNYRIWTLTAAKNLYPGSCAEFDKVKAAWAAVSVPAQTGEPTCTTQGNTVTVTNPGNKSGVVGTATSLQMTGSSSGGGALTWTATGLPAGLSINATTGLISGTPTTAGTYNVTVTGKDSSNATGSTTFTWTITSGTGGGTELQNGVAKTGISGAAGSSQNFTLQVPAGATGLKFVTSDGTGDADLYVKFGSAPTTSSYDCRSEGSTNAETCNIATAQAGTYHVLIKGYSAFSGLSLTGSYTAGSGGGTVLTNGVPVTGLSAATGASKSFTMVVPSGATGLKFTISGGTGDADLYVKFGSAPTTSSYDCRPYLSGNSETCTITTAQAGTYYVMVRAYSAYSGVTLTGSHS